MFNRETFEIIQLENHSDQRGNLFEFLKFKDMGMPGDGTLFFSTIKKGFRRGDHFHKIKRTWFTCVSGESVVLLDDQKGNKTKLILSSKKPTLIYCAPKVARAIYNEKEIEAVLVFYISPQNDPDIHDIFPKVVEYETS